MKFDEIWNHMKDYLEEVHQPELKTHHQGDAHQDGRRVFQRGSRSNAVDAMAGSIWEARKSVGRSTKARKRF